MTLASTTDLAAEVRTFHTPARVVPGWTRVATVLLAAVFRLWALDMRPPHFDEGVNGMFTDTMQHTGFYRYDPANYHGPLHFYVLFLFKCLLGRNLWALRLPEVIVGVLTVDWMFRFRRFFGAGICMWAALAMAVSPGFTFFNRYAIHETWLVFFMVLGCWGLLGLWTDGTKTALWAAGMGLAGMILTKETYLIHLGCGILAVGCLLLIDQVLPRVARRLQRRQEEDAKAYGVNPYFSEGNDEPPHNSERAIGRPTLQHWQWRDVWAVVGVGTFAILFFYTGGGFNPKGLEGMVTTFLPWAHKANFGEGHSKPFIYWSQVFLRNEPWAVLGVLASLRYIFWPSPWGWPLRLLAIYGLGAFVAYSLIHYKTPWCVISIEWPFLFLAAAALVEAGAFLPRFGTAATIAFGAALLVWCGYLAWDLNFYRCTDSRENYVYVHTYDEVNEITGPLYDIAAENPENYRLVGTVLCDSVHPLPWLLGDFSHVGYYAHTSKLTPNYNAAFLIVAQNRIKDTEAKLTSPYYKQELRLRPSLSPIYLYLRETEFAHLMPGREVEFQPSSLAGGSALD